MTDQPELFPLPPRKRGRPLAGTVDPGESPEARKKRKASEAAKRFRGTKAYAIGQLRRWQRIVDAFRAEEHGGVVPASKLAKPRTPEQRNKHREQSNERYWRKKREREELAASLAKPELQESLAIDDLPPGFAPLPPAEQKRLAFAEARVRLETLVASNRLAGRGNALVEFAWFTFEPVHYFNQHTTPLLPNCEKCGLRLETPLGWRAYTYSDIAWAAHSDDNCHAMPDVPDEVFWPPRLEGVYGEMCRDPAACSKLGYCPRDPTCAD